MTTKIAIPPSGTLPATGAVQRKTCAKSRCRILGAIFLVLTVSWVASPPVHAQMSASLQQQVDAVRMDRNSRTPTQKKIHSQLLYAARQATGAVALAGAPNLRSNVKAERDGRFKVKITAAVSPELLAAIKALGGSVLSSYPKYRAIYALMPPAKLETLAGRADVAFIGLPAKAIFNDGSSGAASAAPASSPLNSSLSNSLSGPQTQEVDTSVNDPEGDVTHGANLARAKYGVSGAGVTVGVLSGSINDSSDSYETALDNGYIPPVFVPDGQDGGISDAEGLAMLEVVHRLAPGATLCFATGGSEGTDGADEEQMAENIETLQEDGCQIILDDLSYEDEDPFQDSTVALAVDDVTAEGVLYFSCAANFGNLDSATSSCWEGDFVSTAGDGYLDFATVVKGAKKVIEYNQVASQNTSVDVVLFWAEPLGGATSQYNLYEINSEDRVVQVADDDVAATGQPMQILANVTPGDYIYVQLASGSARYLHLDIAAQNSFFVNVATNGRVGGHNACDAVNSFCVAATPAHRASTTDSLKGPTGPYPHEFSSSNRIERFSDDGRRRMFFNPDGTAITPGNFTSTGGEVFSKPDFTAADGVTTSVPAVGGEAPFFGTSCATPHAGALAALALSYNLDLTPAQVAVALREGALEIARPGAEFRDAGDGILLAPDILGAVQSETEALEGISFKGRYTALILPPADSSLPQGAGYATLTVSAKGGVVMAGALADGEPFSTSGVIVSGTQFIVNTALSYPSVTVKKAKGSLAGTLTFETLTGNSDFSGTLAWTKPPQSKGEYPAAIDTNLNVIGSLYIVGARGSVLPEFTTGTLELSDTSGFVLTAISQLTSQNTLVVTNPPDSLKVTITVSTGVFKGSFQYPVPGKGPKLTDFAGVLFQDQNLADGYFLGPNGSGDINLTSP